MPTHTQWRGACKDKRACPPPHTLITYLGCHLPFLAARGAQHRDQSVESARRHSPVDNALVSTWSVETMETMGEEGVTHRSSCRLKQNTRVKHDRAPLPVQLPPPRPLHTWIPPFGSLLLWLLTPAGIPPPSPSPSTGTSAAAAVTRICWLIPHELRRLSFITRHRPSITPPCNRGVMGKGSGGGGQG